MEKLCGKQLEIMAYRARLLGLDAVHTAASGHIGGSLSAVDAITTLYFNVMNIDPKNPRWDGRDRFVLSKGHCTPALYPVLALRGFRVEELTEVGGGKHLRLRLTSGRHSWVAIFFSTTARLAAVSVGDRVDLAFTPQINEYRGQRMVQLNLVDIRPDE